MKKTLEAVFIVLFICAGLYACIDTSKNETEQTTINETIEKTEENNKKEQIAAEKTTFELGEVYNDNGIIITATYADEEMMKFEIQNNTEKEYEVYVYPEAINNTMEKFKMLAVVENISRGKKTIVEVDLKTEKQYEKIKSFSFVFSFYEKNGSAISFMEFETMPIVIKSNNYDENYEYMGHQMLYDENGIEIGGVEINNDYVEISIINKSDNYYKYNIRNTSINEYSYDVNENGFAYVYDERIFSHCQDILRINYEYFTKENDIDVNQFGFVLTFSDIEGNVKFETETITIKK